VYTEDAATPPVQPPSPLSTQDAGLFLSKPYNYYQ